MSGKAYQRIQMKNHWDVLKKDWLLWNNLLRNETSLSHDTLTGAISASNEWWTKKLERYPDATKFRRMLLQFVEELDILFSDAAVIGEWAYTPSSRVMPHTDKTLEEFHTPHDVEFHDDADLKVVHPFDLNKNRPSNIDGSSNKSKTKNKLSGVTLLNKTLDSYSQCG
ncbi:hypothetical protein ACSBR2_025656 [Camellia fascicularis]